MWISIPCYTLRSVHLILPSPAVTFLPASYACLPVILVYPALFLSVDFFFFFSWLERVALGCLCCLLCVALQCADPKVSVVPLPVRTRRPLRVESRIIALSGVCYTRVTKKRSVFSRYMRKTPCSDVQRWQIEAVPER